MSQPLRTRTGYAAGRNLVIALALCASAAGISSVRAESAAGTINTVAGSRAPGSSTSYGYSGDSGPATQAQLYQPRAVAFDAAGNAYVADALNHRIRKIDTGGIITTVAGKGTPGYSGDGGPAVQAGLDTPHGVAVHQDGSLYIADSANHRIRKIDSAGTITTVAGTGTPGSAGVEGPAAKAQVKNPKTLVVDPSGALYFTDSGNNRVCKIGSDGVLKIVAGDKQAGATGDGGPADRALLNTPTAVWRTDDGSLLIADSDNHRVRRVDPQGVITTVAGTGTAGAAGDGGPAVQAQLNDPRGVISDAAGNIYIGEELGHRVRRVDPQGVITTIAGTGQAGYSGDGGPATAGAFDHVRGLAFDPSGNLWIADVYNNRIRMVSGVAPGTGGGTSGTAPPSGTDQTGGPDQTGQTPDQTSPPPDQTSPPPDQTDQTAGPDQTGQTPDQTDQTADPDQTGQTPDQTDQTAGPDQTGQTPDQTDQTTDPDEAGPGGPGEAGQTGGPGQPGGPDETEPATQ